MYSDLITQTLVNEIVTLSFIYAIIWRSGDRSRQYCRIEDNPRPQGAKMLEVSASVISNGTAKGGKHRTKAPASCRASVRQPFQPAAQTSTTSLSPL